MSDAYTALCNAISAALLADPTLKQYLTVAPVREWALDQLPAFTAYAVVIEAGGLRPERKYCGATQEEATVNLHLLVKAFPDRAAALTGQTVTAPGALLFARHVFTCLHRNALGGTYDPVAGEELMNPVRWELIKNRFYWHGTLTFRAWLPAVPD